MEKLKAVRKQYRRLFMIDFNDFNETESELSVENKISKLKIIAEKAKLMVACEYEFRELLFTSKAKKEKIKKEIDKSEGYIEKWRFLENNLNDLIDEKKEHLDSSSTVSEAKGRSADLFNENNPDWIPSSDLKQDLNRKFSAIIAVKKRSNEGEVQSRETGQKIVQTSCKAFVDSNKQSDNQSDLSLNIKNDKGIESEEKLDCEKYVIQSVDDYLIKLFSD